MAEIDSYKFAFVVAVLFLFCFTVYDNISRAQEIVYGLWKFSFFFNGFLMDCGRKACLYGVNGNIDMYWANAI